MRDKHKVRIRKTKDGYATHQMWLQRKGTTLEDASNDILNGDNHWEGHAPWVQIPLSDMESDRLEALQNLYPALKGRQKQIVALLFDGLTSQTDIAKRLNMKQSNVNQALRQIMKKILKKVI